ncbi:nadh-ubiquinone oxidoreductase 29.9 kda subunit, mitochondrial [Acrodontium crateriforme]|uniref:Nadh-ubiquinone oxidoreductase 29.9 kDa subunit, mitochondrial n=1 Tax=Acrodontium crateriforme TaxID=150365 RepID=A0AAQ3R890_9PEZI|nr:nadh-ubiquinone oxidoreductase 29.9 kda subunit, mitochondrial [Acrodontium crateriforme]
MRAAFRLLASVQRSQYLEAGAPTGLTGLLTHPSPRSALIYLYSETLEKLGQFPESSVYRQSTEALTKHRLALVEKAQPAGLAEWQARAQQSMDKYPNAFKKVPTLAGGKDFHIVFKEDVTTTLPSGEDGEFVTKASNAASRREFEKLKDGIASTRVSESRAELEGPRTPEERKRMFARMAHDQFGEQANVPTIESEPNLTADQINQLETEIGAGLIEEVIQVAEGELKLAHTLAESKIWEPLEEKAAEGQWVYAER